MENKTPPIQPTTPAPQAPVVNPQPPIKTGGKNNGLVIVAIILIALISVLGVLYYLIIKQSYQATTPLQTTAIQTVKPTSAPSPTVTPTDEQILQDNAISDPTKDIFPLQQNANNL